MVKYTKKSYSKKRYSKKRYSKKRYIKKRYTKKRYTKKKRRGISKNTRRFNTQQVGGAKQAAAEQAAEQAAEKGLHVGQDVWYTLQLHEPRQAASIAEVNPNGTYTLNLPSEMLLNRPLELDASRLTVMNNRGLRDQASSLYSRRIAGADAGIHVYSPRLSEDVKFLLNVHKKLLSKGFNKEQAKRAIIKALYYGKGDPKTAAKAALAVKREDVEAALRGEYVGEEEGRGDL